MLFRSKNMTKVSQEFYNNGFKLDGEGRRVDVIKPGGKKSHEIFFLEDDGVLIMSEEHVRTAKGILEISVDLTGKPIIVCC